jgi:hypothetical protein
MRLPKDYDSDPLIRAVTALDWSKDPSAGAMKIIQATVQERFDESLSTADAVWLLGSLLDRRLIRVQTHPDEADKRRTDAKLRHRSKYFRIAPGDANH